MDRPKVQARGEEVVAAEEGEAEEKDEVVVEVAGVEALEDIKGEVEVENPNRSGDEGRACTSSPMNKVISILHNERGQRFDW